jgi:hypothetical protein
VVSKFSTANLGHSLGVGSTGETGPGLIFTGLFELSGGLFAFLWYGGQDVIQHYALRFIIYWEGDTPLRYADFLDYAVRLVFLQEDGGGYIFIHRLLLEHFAAMRRGEKGTAPISRGSHLRRYG